MLGIGQIDIDRLPEIRRQLDRLISRVLDEIPAGRVILHGSFATGRIHQGSDIDLIVVADFSESFVDRVERVHALNTDRLPIEVLAYTPDEFDQMWREGNPFLRRAVEAGRVRGGEPLSGDRSP